MRRTLAVALTAALCCGPLASVHAQTLRALLLAPPAGDERLAEAVARVKGELAAAGFRVTEERLEDGQAADGAMAQARTDDPDAAVVVVRLDPAVSDIGGGLQIWVYEPWRSTTALVPIVIDRVEPGLSIKRGAVQAVELLRAALEQDALERATQAQLPTPSDGALSDSPPPDAAEADGAEADGATARASAHLAAGLALWSGFDGLGSALTPLVRLALALPWQHAWPELALDVRASAAGFGQRSMLDTAEGSVSVRQTLLTGELVLRGWPHALVQPLASAGAGAYAVSVEGQAVAPFSGRSARTWSGVVGAGAGLWIAPARHIAGSIEGQLLLSTAPTEVRVGERVAALAGEPMLVISAQLMGAL
jgi:hypothetical protein